MSDEERVRGNLSIMRRTAKTKKRNPDAIHTSGLKSFTYSRKGGSERHPVPLSRTFNKRVAQTVLGKKH